MLLSRSALVPIALTLSSLGACATGPNYGKRGGAPNVVFVLADDLGYGDLGCYGQQEIATPRLDQMAKEGMKFRQFYAGATVCAPSRAVLMTGKHTGHARVRANAGSDIQTLVPGEVTVARLAKQGGMTTGLVGKWGLGDEGNTGHPNDQGFDQFYGYLNQVHAHNYYPEFLWRNHTREPLGNVVIPTEKAYGSFRGGHASTRVDYTHDLFAREALSFIEAQKDKPFFLYLALTIPHANNEAKHATGDGQEVPDYGAYADRDWPDSAKGQAAMISRMDADVGRILDRIDALGLGEDTVVMFSSDNGPHSEGAYDPVMFNPGGPLRGMKRDLYEGGIRVPMIVRWTGTTPADTISDHMGYFGDLMATVAELTGTPVPAGLDSVSFVPEITGQGGKQEKHAHLYWEFYERAGAQAVRMKKWKAVRFPFGTGPIELFDLTQDLGEQNDVAAQHPDVVKQMETTMNVSHVPDTNWKVGGKVATPPPIGHGEAPF